MTTTSETSEPAPVSDLEYAQKAMFAVLDQAKRERPKARKSDLTVVEAPVEAPYAKEWRLLLSQVAGQHNVFAVGTVRGNLRGGYTVNLFGYKQDITAALETWAHVRAHAEAGMTAASPRAGEDVATFRSSWLLGYRLGMGGFQTPEGVDEQVAVEEDIAARVPSTPRQVRARSTGSGAYAGFLAGRGSRQQDSEAALALWTQEQANTNAGEVDAA